MPGKDLGTKHTCFKCSTKFYDMRKPVPVCPRCGADQRESPALRPPPSEKRSRAAARPPEKVVEEVAEEAEAEPDEAEGDDDDDEP